MKLISTAILLESFGIYIGMNGSILCFPVMFAGVIVLLFAARVEADKAVQSE